MVSTDLKHISLSVCLLATLLAGLVAMALLVMGMMSPLTFLFLISGYILMTIHWFLLVWLVSGLFSGERGFIFARGMLSALPVCLALAVLFIAIKRVPTAVIAAVIGLSLVPVSETLCALRYGIGGMMENAKGVANE